MIMIINLTRNTYNCFIEEQECFLQSREGMFDEMAAGFLPDVYPSYREDFASFYSRENIQERFRKGERELYMEVQAKGVRQRVSLDLCTADLCGQSGRGGSSCY